MRPLILTTGDADQDARIGRHLRRVAAVEFVTAAGYSALMNLPLPKAKEQLEKSSDHEEAPFESHWLLVNPKLPSARLQRVYSLREVGIGAAFGEDYLLTAHALTRLHSLRRRDRPFAHYVPTTAREWYAIQLLTYMIALSVSAKTPVAHVTSWRHDPLRDRLGLRPNVGLADGYIVLRGQTEHTDLAVFIVLDGDAQARSVSRRVSSYLYGFNGVEPPGQAEVAVWASTLQAERTFLAELARKDPDILPFVSTTNGLLLPLQPDDEGGGNPLAPTLRLGHELWLPALASSGTRTARWFAPLRSTTVTDQESPRPASPSILDLRGPVGLVVPNPISSTREPAEGA